MAGTVENNEFPVGGGAVSHTPGPYELYTTPDGMDLLGADGYCIAHFDVHGPCGEIERANGHLLFAAPDLLKALEASWQLLSVAVLEAQRHEDREFVERLVEQLGKNEVAIDKARGAQS